MLVDPNGNPISSEDKFVVQMRIIHKPAGRGKTRYVNILNAEPDGNIQTAKQVLAGAMEQCIRYLVKNSALETKKPHMDPKNAEIHNPLSNLNNNSLRGPRTTEDI